MSELLVERGQRGVIVGSTGSGKTQMLLAQIRNYPDAPVYIIDTKGDAGIEQFVSSKSDQVKLITSPDQIAAFAKDKSGEPYAHVVPAPDELSDPETLDLYLLAIYNAGYPCLVCIDESYQFHKNGRAYAGLISLLTRGRSKGMSLLACTQRPAWNSLFLFTESQKFFVYRLGFKDDYKKLRDYGIPIASKKLDKFHFFFYKNGEDEGEYYRPIKLKFDPGYTVEVKQGKKFY